MRFFKIKFDEYEQRLLANLLNDYHIELNRKGKYTDMVDDLIIKICEAKKVLF